MKIVWPKLALFVACFVPIAMLLWDLYRALGGDLTALGADPGEEIVHRLGNWSIRMLLITLAVSSIARLAHRPALIRYRRMLGLFAFLYVCLHLLGYALLLAGAELAAILSDFSKRPYIIAGGSALLLLIPLALTSTRSAQRRLKRNWTRLHKLIYPAVILGVVHIAWLAKVSYVDAYLYGTLALLLLAERVYHWLRRRSRSGSDQ